MAQAGTRQRRNHRTSNPVSMFDDAILEDVGQLASANTVFAAARPAILCPFSFPGRGCIGFA